LPAETIEAIAQRAAALVLAELREEANAGRWLTGAKAAAKYLGCSPRRVYALLPALPHAKEEGRLVFHTRDLDAYRRSLS
jgi:hypothetical protein